MTDAASGDFREPWSGLTADGARPFEDQARTEISPGHVLHPFDLRAIARCGGCDDVVFRVSDGAFAIVHLVWSAGPQVPPWPRTARMGGFIALEMAMDQHEH